MQVSLLMQASLLTCASLLACMSKSRAQTRTFELQVESVLRQERAITARLMAAQQACRSS